MKIRLVKKLLLMAFFLVIAGVWNESKAQVVLFPKKDKSHNTVLFPRTNRTSSVIVNNGNNLPPGQAKKIYGEKSAKRFAPGQRKKAYNNNWQYSTNNKHGKKVYKNPKKHDD